MKDGQKLFASKTDLEAAHKKVAQLEAENRTLKNEITVLKTKPLSRQNLAQSATSKPQMSAPPSASAYRSRTISRAEFQALSDRERMDFCKSGGRIA